MKSILALAILIGATTVATPAFAITYGGNPNLTLKVIKDSGDLTGGSVYLTKIRVFKCTTGYHEITVNETIDPTVEWESTLTLPSGSYCSAKVFWGTDLDLDGSNTAGTYDLIHEEPSTSITFGENTIPTVELFPYVVTSGEPCGAPPELKIDLVEE